MFLLCKYKKRGFSVKIKNYICGKLTNIMGIMKQNETASNAGVHNTLSAGTVVKGNINTENDFRLDGQVEGDVVCGGKIVLGPKGFIKGSVVAQNAEIHGQVEGTLKVSGHLSLKASAVLKGDVVVQSLEIEPNAAFNGSCSMSGKEK